MCKNDYGGGLSLRGSVKEESSDFKVLPSQQMDIINT